MSLLSKMLEKAGVKSKAELDPVERAQFDRWEAVLTGGEITVDRIKQFCENQLELIETQWRNLDNSERKNERLIVLHTVYSTLLEVVAGKRLKAEKEALELYLEEQLK